MSTSKAKGTAFETAIVNYFLKYGFNSTRRVALSGMNDKGDIHIGAPNNPQIVIECKNYAKELPYKMVEDFIAETYNEYLNAKAMYKPSFVDPYSALLIVKRVNLGIPDSWIIWKNLNGITIRARLGDIVNDKNFSKCITEEESIACLHKYLSD